MKKTYTSVLLILGVIALVVAGFFIYATIMTFGNQKMPMTQLTPELIELEKLIQKETHDPSSRIEPLPQHKIEDYQNDKFDITVILNNNNDSVNLDTYTKSVMKKIKKILPYKDCTDSIIIKVYNYKDDKEYRYSFPAE
jgi:hypothetical protein